MQATQGQAIAINGGGCESCILCDVLLCRVNAINVLSDVLENIIISQTMSEYYLSKNPRV
jgi:hypothetical protein